MKKLIEEKQEFIIIEIELELVLNLMKKKKKEFVKLEQL